MACHPQAAAALRVVDGGVGHLGDDAFGRRVVRISRVPPVEGVQSPAMKSSCGTRSTAS
jgi:hypothetical protein